MTTTNELLSIALQAAADALGDAGCQPTQLMVALKAGDETGSVLAGATESDCDDRAKIDLLLNQLRLAAQGAGIDLQVLLRL